MASRSLPEGLEEMAKHKEGIDRRELLNTYQELVDEAKETSLGRRTILRAFAGGGALATLNTLFAQKKFIGESFDAGLKAIDEHSTAAMGVREIDEPPYEVSDDYERVSKEFRRLSVDTSDTAKSDAYLVENALHAGGAGTGKLAKYNIAPIEASSPGEVRAIDGLVRALKITRGALRPYNENPEMPFEEALDEYQLNRSPDITDPEKLTRMAKTTARVCGTTVVGTGKLDKRWFYKEVEFRDVESPTTTEDGNLVIPESFDNVISGLVEYPYHWAKMGHGKVEVASYGGYSMCNVVAVGLATWIRSMGYQAIPSRNGIALNDPITIDCGLGEEGRTDRMINPEIGGSIKSWKVFTDMPLEPDPYIEFGLKEFCEGCKICADTCPSKSIIRGNRTWEYAGPEDRKPYRNSGVKKWHTNPGQCNEFTDINGGFCQSCMMACPYTEGQSWVHDVIKSTAGKNRTLDSGIADMGRTFGYDDLYLEGEEREALWYMDYAPRDRFLDPYRRV